MDFMGAKSDPEYVTFLNLEMILTSIAIVSVHLPVWREKADWVGVFCLGFFNG